VNLRRSIATAVFVVCAAWAGSGQVPAVGSPNPVFRTSVDLVSVAAVVRDRRGQVVRDLGRDDFEVFDNGVRRPILEFTPSDDGPLSLALLVDVSGSMVMGSGLDAARAWVGMLLDRLRPGIDEAAVFSFDRALREQHAFDRDLGAVRASLSSLRPFGATSLYDAIGETAQRLTARDHKRRAILVLTDGLDNGSRLTPAQVSGLASATDVPVYVLALLSAVDLATAGAGGRFQDPTGTLANLAAWTGGSAFVVTSPAQASVATQKMLSDLRHQYLLAFEAAGPAGWRALDIRLRRRELTVRARSGYFVNPPLG
jgi:Ca-activated chloride channel family protein